MKTEMVKLENGEGVRRYRRQTSFIRPIWTTVGDHQKFPTTLPTTQPLENYWHIESFRSAVQGIENDFASFDFRVPHCPLPCHSEHHCTAAIAPVSALCQIEQMPWGPERPVKWRQVSQELKRSPRRTPSANTQREEQERAKALGFLRKSSPTKCFYQQLTGGQFPHA